MLEHAVTVTMILHCFRGFYIGVMKWRAQFAAQTSTMAKTSRCCCLTSPQLEEWPSFSLRSNPTVKPDTTPDKSESKYLISEIKCLFYVNFVSPHFPFWNSSAASEGPAMCGRPGTACPHTCLVDLQPERIRFSCVSPETRSNEPQTPEISNIVPAATFSVLTFAGILSLISKNVFQPFISSPTLNRLHKFPKSSKTGVCYL